MTRPAYDRARSAGTALLTAFFVLALGGCLDPLVGAECAPGLRCERGGDGGGPADGRLHAGPLDAGSNDAGPLTTHDGSLDQSPGGDRDVLGDGEGFVEPGAADALGPTPTTDGAPGDVAPLCPLQAGLVACPEGCVNLASDPDNCGGCGNRCVSGLCGAGVCRGDGAGHLVVIGHDYSVGRTGINRLAGNAVFLSPGNPVKVLAYEGAASAASIAGTNRAIEQGAVNQRRIWMRTVAAEDAVATQLAASDVFVIHAQGGANNAQLQALGLRWGASLTAFLASGKVVLLLDGGAGNAGTHQILTAAGLLDVRGRQVASGETMTVVQPGDSLASLVPRNYLGEANSVRYETPDTVVIVRAMNQAVVLHKIF